MCSGNSCRSPVAEGFAKKIALQNGFDMEFYSAGTLGIEGILASPEAIFVSEEKGVDISKHKSMALSADLIARADIIFGMEYAHLERVKQYDVRGKNVLLLGLEEIDDPIGKGLEFYRCIRDEIVISLERALSLIKNED